VAKTTGQYFYQSVPAKPSPAVQDDQALFALAAQRDNGRHERAAESSDIEAATLSRRSTVLALRPLFDYFGLDATPAANMSVGIDLS
jgi:hypothetical protein